MYTEMLKVELLEKLSKITSRIIGNHNAQFYQPNNIKLAIKRKVNFRIVI